MPYQNAQQAIEGLNTLITELGARRPPLTLAQVTERINQWSEREFTDPDKDNPILKRVRNVVHPDKIQQGTAISPFSMQNIQYLKNLATPSSKFAEFFTAIPPEVTKTLSDVEQIRQDNALVEEERVALQAEHQHLRAMGDRLQQIKAELTELSPHFDSMTALRQKLQRSASGDFTKERELLTEYDAILKNVNKATEENNAEAFNNLRRELTELLDYNEGVPNVHTRKMELQLDQMRANHAFLTALTAQVKILESGSPKPRDSEQGLNKLQQMLSRQIDNGTSAVTMHPGSQTNPGKQVRVEFNFDYYKNSVISIYHIGAVKKSLIEMGLLAKDYQMPTHGYLSSFIVLQPDANNPILNSPNFERKFKEIYEKQKKQAEIEHIETTLKLAINDGGKAVTVHPGSAANPGLQIRIEYNFPPHNENGTFNADHYTAVRSTLMELGLIDRNYMDQFHGESPFIVIRPTAGNRFLNDPDFTKKFQEIYEAKFNEKNATLIEINSEINKINGSLKYVQDPGKTSTHRLAQEENLNAAILRILTLAEKGDPSQNMSPNPNWVSKNTDLLTGYLTSDYVSHTVKQKIQKLIKPEEYYARSYVAGDPLINMVMQKLLESEKSTLSSKSFPGGYNVSLGVDGFLKKMEALDKDALMLPYEKANLANQLMRVSAQLTDNKELRSFISKVQKDPQFTALLNTQTEPKAVTLAELTKTAKEIENTIAYLNRGMHNTTKTEAAIEILNDDINTIVTLAEHGDKEKGIQPYPNWVAENKERVNKWLQNKDVSPETKGRLQQIITPAVAPPDKTQPTAKVSGSPSSKTAATAPPPRASTAAPASKAAPTPPPRTSTSAPASKAAPVPPPRASKAPNLPPRPETKGGVPPTVQAGAAHKLPPTPRDSSPPRAKVSVKADSPAPSATKALGAKDVNPLLRELNADPRIKAAIRPTPPPRNVSPSRTAPPEPPPRGGSGEPLGPRTPPKPPPRATQPGTVPERKNFLPGQQVRVSQFKAELESKLKNKQPEIPQGKEAMSPEKVKPRTSGGPK